MSEKTSLRKGVFFPAFLVTGAAVVIGIFKNEWLKAVCKSIFGFSLLNFGWLYQMVAMICFFGVLFVTFSKTGNLRIGGKDAQPKYPFHTWFMMALTGGISVGIVNWGINEPMVYFGNVYGELETLGIDPLSPQAAHFAIARCFYNWSFVPYAFYGVTGVLMAYLFYNKKEKFSVAATLTPLFGQKAYNSTVSSILDTLCTIGIVLGMACGLGTGMAFILSGVKLVYGVDSTITIWIILGTAITALFTGAAYLGLDKGIKKLATLNSKIFYALLIILFFTGPIIDICKSLGLGLAVWLDNFWLWGLDPVDIGGEALTVWWTLFDWTVWVAYAPVMGLFLAKISYGRTIREFMIINWILPSCFGLVWFSVWGGTALNWQTNGVVDLVAILKEYGAVSAVWGFLQNLPFGLGIVLIPVVMVTLVLSFSTAADSITHTLASLCVSQDDNNINDEAPNSLKVIWGVIIGSISVIMGALAGGVRGVDGVRQLSAVGAFIVLSVFILQVAAFLKVFFLSKLEDE